MRRSPETCRESTSSSISLYAYQSNPCASMKSGVAWRSLASLTFRGAEPASASRRPDVHDRVAR